MHTYYELPIAGFLQFLLSYVRERKTGIVFFFSNSADWGKLVINQGNIQSVRFKTLKGTEALPSIQELKLVQYHIRPEEPARLAPAQDDGINNANFFGFFGISLAPSVSVTTNEAEQAAVVISEHKTAIVPRSYAKILVADDSPTARKAVSRILVSAGYQVVEASNGFEALGQLQNERPDLLLLDLIMPGIDGYTVIKTLSRMQDAPRIPIVVLTSRDSLLDKLKGMALSCDAYITKPVESNTLLEVTRRYLPDA